VFCGDPGNAVTVRAIGILDRSSIPTVWDPSIQVPFDRKPAWSQLNLAFAADGVYSTGPRIVRVGLNYRHSGVSINQQGPRLTHDRQSLPKLLSIAIGTNN
jgi:hypothetical protein